MRLRPIALLVLAACGRREPEQADTRAAAIRAAAPAPPAAPADTAFHGTTGALHRARAGAAPGILAAVQVASGPGYDRIVFEFASDSVPGYRVEYASRPARRCGSGDPVSVGGAGRLLVRFEPARAHDDAGAPTVVERERAPGLPAVKEMKLVCDFEGRVEWVIGVALARDYRVVEDTGPARVIIDVQHPP